MREFGNVDTKYELQNICFNRFATTCMKRLSKNWIFKHLFFLIHIWNSKPSSDKILSPISYHQMTKVFTRLLLKQYLMQNQPNKILESKQKAPKLKKEIKILNIFDKKIKWKLFCLHDVKICLKHQQKTQKYWRHFFLESQQISLNIVQVIKFIGDMFKHASTSQISPSFLKKYSYKLGSAHFLKRLNKRPNCNALAIPV